MEELLSRCYATTLNQTLLNDDLVKMVAGYRFIC